VHEFNEVGWIPSIVEHIWNVDTIIPEASLVGQLLKTLFGYSSSPSLTEMIAYFVYIAVVTVLWRRETAPVKAVATSQA
jgi:high-affinity iron transporter